MTAETIHVSNCPTCGHFPTQAICGDVATYRALTLPPASDAAITQPGEVVAWAFKYCGDAMVWRNKPSMDIPFTDLRPLTYADTRDAGEDTAIVNAATEVVAWLDWQGLAGWRTQALRAAIDAAKAAQPGRGGDDNGNR